jgi:hypothetical protein
MSAAQITTLLMLKGIDPLRAQECAELSQGSLGMAEKLSQEDLWKKKNEIDQFLLRPSSHMNSLIDWAAQSTTHCELLLFLLEQACLKAAQTETKASTPSIKKINFYTEQLTHLFDFRKTLHAPLNQKLQLQKLLMPFTRISA